MSAKEEALKNEFQFASSSIVAHIVRGVLDLGLLWDASSRVFVFDRAFVSFCSGRLQGDVWSTTLFAGDAVGVW